MNLNGFKKNESLKNTDLTTIEYGKDIVVNWNGFSLKRHYPVKICNLSSCNNQILAGTVKRGFRYSLMTNGVFDDREYCCHGHASRDKANQRIGETA